ncbi:MAG: hypothetical protein RLZZ175_1620 [Bacteroidota bacterium]|jgi:peroxiredoxin
MKNLFILIASAFLFFSCKKQEVNPETGEVAPAFSLKDLNGNTVQMSDYKGKVVLLFFLGNSCPSCKAVAPGIENTFVKGYANNSNFVLLGLDAWDGDKTAVSAFKSSTSVTFPLLSEASEVAANYKVAYDRLVVVDKNGFVRFKGSQLASNDIGSAKTVVDTYLSK